MYIDILEKKIAIKIARNTKNLKKTLCNFFLLNETNHILKFKVDLQGDSMITYLFSC